MKSRLLTSLLVSAVAVVGYGAGDVGRNPWPSSVYGSMLIDQFTPFDVGGMLLWLNFDQSGSAWYDDQSGNEVALVFGGSVYPTQSTDTPCSPHAAEFFDNSSMSDVDPFSTMLRDLDEFTICTWVSLDSLGKDRDFITERNDNNFGTGNELELRYDVGDDLFEINVYDGSYKYAKGDIDPQTGTWYHICGWYDSNLASGTLRIYENGTVGSTVATGVGPLSNDGSACLALGALRDCTRTANNRKLDGDLDDIRIYDRALTSGEIEALSECR